MGKIIGIELGTTNSVVSVMEGGQPTVRAAANLLIVDDDPSVRAMLLEYLGGHGYAVRAAGDGAAMRAELERELPDLVLLDLRLPGEDGLTLARYLRAGELTPVAVPDTCDEAMRDLTRAREDAVRARLKARQQLKAMLLRHGHRYTGKTSWTAAHERYLGELRFDHPAQDIAYAEYRSAVREAHERVERITAALREQAAAEYSSRSVGNLLTRTPRQRGW